MSAPVCGEEVLVNRAGEPVVTGAAVDALMAEYKRHLIAWAPVTVTWCGPVAALEPVAPFLAEMADAIRAGR